MIQNLCVMLSAVAVALALSFTEEIYSSTGRNHCTITCSVISGKYLLSGYHWRAGVSYKCFFIESLNLCCDVEPSHTKASISNGY